MFGSIPSIMLRLTQQVPFGSWTATTSLPAATEAASSVVYNGYVYEIGGNTTSAINTVDYAPITATIPSVPGQQPTTYLHTDLASSVVYNGYVYEIGGHSNYYPVSTVYYAPINSNGTSVPGRQPPAYLQLPMRLTQ